MFQHWACGGLGGGWRIILILNMQAFFSQTPVPKVILMGIFFGLTECLHVLHVRRKKPCMSYMSYMSDVKNAPMSYISYIAESEKENVVFFEFYNVRYVRHRKAFHVWHVRHVRHGWFFTYFISDVRAIDIFDHAKHKVRPHGTIKAHAGVLLSLRIAVLPSLTYTSTRHLPWTTMVTVIQERLPNPTKHWENHGGI